MICKDYKCVFIHIPKTGGQSIEHFLLNSMGLTWDDRSPFLLRFNPDPNLGPERLAHLTAVEYVDRGYLDAVEFGSYFKFAFVRNPWDRLVSEYLYRKHNKHFTFKDFILRGFPEPDPYKDAYRHVMPQYDFIFDAAGKQLVDFVGRFENLQQDFDMVCQKLGIEGHPLPHVNSQSERIAQGRKARLKRILFRPFERIMKRNQRMRYRVYYDRECLEAVSSMYRKDIETFQYTYGA